MKELLCVYRKKTNNVCKIPDKKIFSLPRRFTKDRCDQGINGFTMREKCAPYKDCLKKQSKKKNKKRTYRGGTKQRTETESNMIETSLEPCSKNPITGYSRSGYCNVVPGDQGVHTVCAQMTQPFLDFTKDKGNDLSSVVFR